ncbi:MULTISPECIES: M12 family metallo-peptidase [Hyphobacterium]|uniref:M12 family metallo-peptidase n=1 Tax=Hyphobacterium vulgare TaxID=1736751 RepID=A0ABV6ZYC5_9PROT
MISGISNAFADDLIDFGSNTAIASDAGTDMNGPVRHTIRGLDPLVMAMTPGESIALNFGPGGDAILDRIETNATGTRIWVGHVEGEPLNRVLLTRTGEHVFGRIQTGEELWLIIPDRNGGHTLFRHGANARFAGFEGDELVPPVNELLENRVPSSPNVVPVTDEAVAIGSLGTVDILVYYSGSFHATWGPAAGGRIQYLMALLDQALVDSDTGLRARLVGTEFISTNDDRGNAATVVDMRSGAGLGEAGPNGQDYSTMLARRNALGADLVAMVRNMRTPDMGNCGTAYVIGATSDTIGIGSDIVGVAAISDWIDDADTDLGNGYTYCTDLTFAHEIGHNLGIAHDLVNSDANRGVREFALGYVNQCGYRTIMAYDSSLRATVCLIDAAPGSNHELEMPYFSNPDLDRCGPTIVSSSTSQPCGTANADAARAMREEGRNVTDFRSEAGFLRSAVLPLTRAVPTGTTATAFATVINPAANGDTATDCGLRLPGANTNQFSYQTTDALNAPTGTVDTPVDIPSGGAQSFVFSVRTNNQFVDNSRTEIDSDNVETDLFVEAFCANRRSAEYIDGVNSFTFKSESLPGPDVIAVAGTPTVPGTVIVPTTGNMVGFFVVAVTNVSTDGAIVASPSIGPNAEAGISSVEICRTDPDTGACTTPRGESVTVNLATNGTATFAIFIRGTGSVVSNLPATNRVFVRFTSTGTAFLSGGERGATSVAVRTD